jgi:DNA-binding NarL/FixJ family response regulator
MGLLSWVLRKDARLPRETGSVTMAVARLGKRRAGSSTLRTVAALIRETDPPLWEILQSVTLHDVTIGSLLEEAKHLRLVQTASPQNDGTFPFHKFLTEREAQVADLVAQGDSNKEIGQRLELSAKTVKNHVSNILRKLALQRRTQIAILALRERTKA